MGTILDKEQCIYVTMLHRRAFEIHVVINSDILSLDLPTLVNTFCSNDDPMMSSSAETLAQDPLELPKPIPTKPTPAVANPAPPPATTVTVLQPRSTWSRTTRTSKKTAKPNHFRWRKTNPMIDLTLRKIDRADSMAAPALTHSPVPLLDVV